MAKRRPVDAVVFDLGGVLIDWNPRHLYRELFGGDEVGMERFLAAICTQPWNEQHDRGRSFSESIAELCTRYPPYERMIRAHRARWPEMLKGADRRLR
jgi:2-haloacid dehalogenase